MYRARRKMGKLRRVESPRMVNWLRYSIRTISTRMDR
jgi:hypothetical protein